jgi:2-dehydropantoate 2-reductase
LSAALDSAAGAARFRGYPVSADFLASTRATLAEPGSTASSSLLRDLEAGRQTEAEQITGALLRETRAAGLDDTLFSAAYTHLKAAERRHRMPD